MHRAIGNFDLTFYVDGAMHRIANAPQTHRASIICIFPNYF
ncbi:MAG: hypothetical protein ACI8ZN_000147 [Bacteroidia bacterium]|jgi:hypothetical protein